MAADLAAMDVDLDILNPNSHTDPDLVGIDVDFLHFVGSDFTSALPFEPPKLPPPCDPVVRPREHEISRMDFDFDSHLLGPQVPTPNNDPGNGWPSSSLSFLNPSSSSQSQGPTTPSNLQRLPPPTPTPPPPPASPPTTCSCLATLYLSLDSLARLPASLHSALRAARAASRAAHDTMRCPACCATPPPSREAPVRLSGFQNMMVLGALLPSIADAYHRILALVDAETARAVRARAGGMPFSLGQLGGLWGSGGDGGADVACGAAAAAYEGRTLPPAEWRLTLRALLKVDVYGFDGREGGPAGKGAGGSTGRRPGFRRLGLRDLVAQMDERSRARHAEIDALIDAGVPPPRGPGLMRAAHTGEGREPPCRRIVAMAREAVESLVIA